MEARSAMHLASVYAGIGFGNAGVHMWYVPFESPHHFTHQTFVIVWPSHVFTCFVSHLWPSHDPLCPWITLSHPSHGMSYPISGLVKKFRTEGYNPDKPLVVRTHLLLSVCILHDHLMISMFAYICDRSCLLFWHSLSWATMQHCATAGIALFIWT